MVASLSNHMMSFVMLLLVSIFTKPLIVVASQVPCYFVFGDSLVDPGNNNLLKTTAKANYPPYGIDFPRGTPTGRFTNGRTVADVLAQIMEFKEFIPAFVGVRDITKGVNYASASAGILDDTSSTLGDRYTLNEQMANHQTIVKQFEVLFGTKKNATEYLRQCIYSFTVGSNDYLNNFFQPDSYNSSRLYTPDTFASLLVQQYSTQLQALYDTGARKVALMGLGSLGREVELFNVKLGSLVIEMNRKLQGAKFTFLDTALITARLNPISSGIVVNGTSCCQVVSGVTCLPNSVPCDNRGRYALFDRIHPTDALNAYIGNVYYNGSSQAQGRTFPYDVYALTQLY